MTHHNDDQLAAWLADGPQHGPMMVLEDALARARKTGQRPGWLVNMTGGTIAQPGDSLLRYAMLAVAVVALLALLVGALIVGGVLPPPNPRPSILVDNTADPSASPQAGLVAYTVTEELQPGEGSCSEDGPRSFCSREPHRNCQPGREQRPHRPGRRRHRRRGTRWLVARWVRSPARRRRHLHRRPIRIRVAVVHARRAVSLPVRRPRGIHHFA